MQSIIQKHIVALAAGDLEKVIALFTDNAIVRSSLYGDLPPRDFFKQLFDDIEESGIALPELFSSVDGTEIYAAHFKYNRVSKNSATVNLECVNSFHFDQKSKIKPMTIICDAGKLRSKYNKEPGALVQHWPMPPGIRITTHQVIAA